MTKVQFGGRKEGAHALIQVLPNTGVVMMVVGVVNGHESQERVPGIEDYLFLASGTAPIMHKYINLSASLCMNYPTISEWQEDCGQSIKSRVSEYLRIRQIGKADGITVALSTVSTMLRPPFSPYLL